MIVDLIQMSAAFDFSRSKSLPYRIRSAFTAHGLQHLLRDMLDGQIDVGDNFRVLRYGPDNCTCRSGRVHVHEPDPFDVVEARDFFDQMGQVERIFPVRPIRAQVLRHEDDLPDPAVCQVFAFVNDLLMRLADELPPDVGDEAVAAMVRTAFAHLDIGMWSRGGVRSSDDP